MVESEGLAAAPPLALAVFAVIALAVAVVALVVALHRAREDDDVDAVFEALMLRAGFTKGALPASR